MKYKKLDCHAPAALAMTSLRGGKADEAIQFDLCLLYII